MACYFGNFGDANSSYPTNKTKRLKMALSTSGLGRHSFKVVRMKILRGFESLRRYKLCESSLID